VLVVVARALELVDGGGSIQRLEQVDFTPLLRARDETGPQDADAVQSAVATVMERLAGAA
jgi:V/A-type H+-transporting ATPase subunit A